MSERAGSRPSAVARVAERAEEIVTGAYFQALPPAPSRPVADPGRAAKRAQKRRRPGHGDGSSGDWLSVEERCLQQWREETRGRFDEPMDYSKIQTRAGPGGNRLHYMPSDAAITLANAYFGFDGWSCEVKETTIDSVSGHMPAAV